MDLRIPSKMIAVERESRDGFLNSSWLDRKRSLSWQSWGASVSHLGNS
jgi:hypothetical protein